MVPDPSTATPWDAFLDAGDVPSAMTAWRRHYAGREHEPEARRACADIEERGGDACVGRDGLSAKGHYLRAADAARDAMEGMARRSGVDAARAVQRCQDAYARAFRKYQSINNQGRVDDVAGLEPHPASTGLREDIEALRAQRRAARDGQNGRLAALLDGPVRSPDEAAEIDRLMGESAYARASGMEADSMAPFALGDRWLAAGRALAADWPATARRALAWSAWFFRRYHADWTAHLPASRWDPDGRDGFECADALRASLGERADPSEAPAWARDLLCGRLPRTASGSPSGEGEPRAFEPLYALLLDAAPGFDCGDRRWT